MKLTMFKVKTINSQGFHATYYYAGTSEEEIRRSLEDVFYHVACVEKLDNEVVVVIENTALNERKGKI